MDGEGTLVGNKDTREFIMVSPDCPVDEGMVPEVRTEPKPIVVHQYEVLSQCPYEYTEAELSHEVHIVRRGQWQDPPRSQEPQGRYRQGRANSSSQAVAGFKVLLL